MSRTLLGLFVMAHGLLTILIWSPRPQGAKAAPPMDTSHSWLFGDARRLAVGLAVVAGVAITAGGVGFLANQPWWPMTMLAGGLVSLLLFLLFFTPWWTAAIAISAALVVAALRPA
jgi:hypothetical protein